MRRLLVAVALIGLTCVSTGASTILSTEFRGVVGDATLIVRGTVTDVRPVAVPGAGIDSIATVAVEHVLKGQASGFVYVRVPGGVIGRTRFVMVGAPTFHTGQQLVLFLRPGAADSAFRPVGLTLGVYPIQPEPTTHKMVVQPPIVPGRTAATSGPTVRGDTKRPAMPIADFESLVRLVAATPTGQAVPRKGR